MAPLHSPLHHPQGIGQAAGGWLASLMVGATLLPAAVLAQSERFILGPGSNVGPSTQIKPTNCKNAADGSVTCDTEVVNPKGDTPARPQYSPFNN